MRHADIAIGTMSAKGNVSLDSRGEVPALQADLAAPAIDLAAILPAGGATADGWGSDRLDLAGLTHTSFVLKLVTDQIEYGGLVSGPSRIAATGKERATLMLSWGLRHWQAVLAASPLALMMPTRRRLSSLLVSRQWMVTHASSCRR